MVKDYPYGTVIVGDLATSRKDYEVTLKRRATQLDVLRVDGDVYVKLGSPGEMEVPLRYVRRVTYVKGFDKIYVSNPKGSGFVLLYVEKAFGLSVEPSVYSVVESPLGIRVSVPEALDVKVLGRCKGGVITLDLGVARNNELVVSNAVFVKVLYSTSDAVYSFNFGGVGGEVYLGIGESLSFPYPTDVYFSNPVYYDQYVRLFYVAVEGV